MRNYALAFLCLLTQAPAQDSAQTPSGSFAVHCGVLYVGDGQVLENAWLVVRDGVIREVTVGGSAPSGLPVLDARDKVVMPGIVAADSNLSGQTDTDYNVTPDFIAVDGFDFSQRQTEALAGGVTTAYIAPGRQRLIPGQGSVVKLAGRDIVARVLLDSACLRITMGREGTVAPRVFEPNPAPTADDPLVPSRRQVPTARISQLAELRRLFRESRATDGSLEGPGAAVNQYDGSALRQVVEGHLPLRIAAVAAADIRRAILFAQRMNSSLVLEDPHEIEKVASLAVQAQVPVVFRIPVIPGAHNSVNAAPDTPQPRLDNPALAVRAGLTVAIAPTGNQRLRDFLTVAAIAIRHGLPEEAALSAITSDAAKVLGVDDRVGSLSVGKDADFLVLSGAPFAIGTMVEKTFIGGEPAYEINTDRELLAVRCKRIYTAEGQIYRDGVIIVADGKIVGIGEDLPVPYGAKVIDLPDATMVPGFLDAFTQLGLAADGLAIPVGTANQSVADVIQPDDPMFRGALEAGLTTILVSGRDGGTVSGRVAAIKTGARDRESMVVKDTAAIRFVHDAIGPDAINTLSAAIDRGRRYIEAWERYETALAEFEAGGGERPVEPDVVPETPEEDRISGRWELEIEESPIPIQFSLELRLEGTAISGRAMIAVQEQELDLEITEGSFERGQLRLTIAGPDGEDPGTLEAEVTEDTMSGSFGGLGQPVQFTGRRVSQDPQEPQEPATTEATDSPQKPNVDQNLEPLKLLLEKKIPAVIRTNRGPALSDVVEYFEEQDLPYILHGAGDAVEMPEVFGEHRPSVLLEPDVVQREGRRLINRAAALSERGLDVALVTGDAQGAQYLPLHAAYAVRYGMNPDEALRALTINPARMFKLDDRVGSLRVGKDADFAVFSGNPFELTSRVLLVVVNGEVVVDNRTPGENR